MGVQKIAVTFGNRGKMLVLSHSTLLPLQCIQTWLIHHADYSAKIAMMERCPLYSFRIQKQLDSNKNRSAKLPWQAPWVLMIHSNSSGQRVWGMELRDCILKPKAPPLPFLMLSKLGSSPFAWKICDVRTFPDAI